MMNDLMQHLASAGWAVTAVICDGPPSQQPIGLVDVICPGDKNRLHDIVKSADVLITQLGATPRARGMGKVYGIPVVQLIHNSSDYTVGFLGDGCDFAIYNSHWIKQFHEGEKKKPLVKSWQSTKVTHIRRRQSSDWPSLIVHPPVLDKTLKESSGEFVTLVNLTPNKGPELFYELAALNPSTQFMGVIGGYEPDKQVIRDLPNVTIHPHVQDMDEIYRQTAVVVMPSKYESYGRIAVEAAQYGIPSIVTPTPGLVEALGDCAAYATPKLELWNDTLRSVIRDYDRYSELAYKRHLELYENSIPELDSFAEAMEGLVKTWHSSRSPISN